MQIRDLLLLVLRIYGISILLFHSVPMLVSNMTFYISVLTEWQTDMVVYVLAIIILPITLALVLIFGSSWLITIFRLDKGFQSNEVMFNSNTPHQLLKLAVILLGGYLIIDNIANTLTHIAEAFRISLSGFEDDTYHNFWKSGLSVFIGALLITNREALAKWLMPKTEE